MEANADDLKKAKEIMGTHGLEDPGLVQRAAKALAEQRAKGQAEAKERPKTNAAFVTGPLPKKSDL